MSVRTDTVNLNININGNKAQADLNNLRKRAADIKFEMQGLVKGTAEYIAKGKELSQVNAQMAELKKTIGIASLTQKELVAELKRLNALKGSIAPFSKEFKELSTQIKAVENRLYDVKNGVQGFSSFFSKIKDEVKQFGVLAAGYLGFQFITTQFQNIIRGAGKLSDQLADLQRVAGLTSQEAIALNNSLKGVDTRTSVEGLRNIAIIAGKLGVAKDDIFEFSKAVDQLVVSLGDELGDADQITTQLGKILNVFDGKIDGDNITKLGNAFVELANTGAATGGFIADFDQRLSGIAKSAGISLGALSGLGAGLEELGGRVESSATAVSKLIGSIAADIPAAAKIAGQSTDEFNKLFNLDPTEALLKYSQGLVKNKASFAEVTSSLKDAGEEGQRTIELITKLGTSADYLRGRIDLGTKSIEESSAITEAFALKNETFGATLEKLGKEFNSLVTSPAVTNFLKDAVDGARQFIEVIKLIPKFISDNKGGIVILTLAYIAYNAEQIKARILTLLNTQVLTSQTAAVRLLAAAKFLLTGNITKAKEAWQAFTAAINKNPLGLLLTAIGLVVVAITTLTGKYRVLAAEQRVAMDVQRKAAELYQDDISRVEKLKKVLTDETSSLTQKKNAYEELIKIHPDFENTLKLDAQGHLDGVAAIDQFILALRRKGQAEARESVAAEKRRAIVQQQIDLAEELTKKGAFGQTVLSQFSNSIAFKELGAAVTPDQKKALRDRAAAINEELQAALKESPQEAFDLVDNIFKKFGGTADNAVGKFGEVLRTIRDLKDELKILDDQTEKDLRKDLDKPKPGGNTGGDAALANSIAAKRAELEAKLKNLKVDYEKIALLDTAAREKNLADQKNTQLQLDALDGKSSKDKIDAKNTEYKRLLEEAKKFQEELRKIEERRNAGENIRQEEVIKVSQKYKELLDKAQEYYDKHIIDLNTFNKDVSIIDQAALKELNDLRKKFFEEDADKNYQAAITAQKDFTDQLKDQYKQQFIDGTITKEQYDDAITASDKNLLINLIADASQWAQFSKKAAADVTVFKKQQYQADTDEAFKQKEARIAFEKEERLAKLNLAVITARPGSKAELDAKKKLLDEEEKEEIKSAKARNKANGIILEEGNDILLKIQAEFNKKRGDLDQQYINSQIDKIQQWAQFAVSALTNLNQLLNNIENAKLEKEKKQSEQKAKHYKKQLDDKLLSQAQYDKKIQKLREEDEQKSLELRKKQAKREKALQLFSAIINTAGAVAKALNNPYPLNIVLAAISAAAGAIQIAAIASQPLPTAGRGKFLKGDKHSDPSGGIHLIAEDGEAIINRRNMADNKQLTVTGNTRQITSYLNSRNGNGVNWAGGAVARESTKWISRKPATLNPSLPQIMALGGVIGTGGTTSEAKQAVNRGSVDNPNAKMEQLTEMLINEQRETRDALNNFNTRIKADVFIKDINEKQRQYDNAKKASSLG